MAIVQVGSTIEVTFPNNTSQSGVATTTLTVPADAELMLVGVSGFFSGAHAIDAGSITFTGTGGSSACTSVSSLGDGGGSSWSAGLFYLNAPETGANKELSWSWNSDTATTGGARFDVTFWKGVDTASPVRGGGGGIGASNTPYTSDTLTAQAGDLIVAYVGAFSSAAEGSVDSWSNLTLLTQLANQHGDHDGAWATTSPSGNTTVAASSDTNLDDGAIVAVVLKAAGAGSSFNPPQGNVTLSPTAPTVSVFDPNQSISTPQGNIALSFTIPNVGADKSTTVVSAVRTAQPVDTSDSTTYTFTAASLGVAFPGRVIAVVVNMACGATLRTLSTVTVGGVSAPVRANQGLDLGSIGVRSAIATVVDTTNATADIVVTFNNACTACGIEVYALHGVANPVPNATGGTTKATGTGNISSTVDCPPNGLVLGGVANSGTTDRTVTWAGITEDLDHTVQTGILTDGAAFLGFSTQQTALAVTVTPSGSVGQALALASFSPALEIGPPQLALALSPTAPTVSVVVAGVGLNPPQGNLALSPTAPSVVEAIGVSPARVDLAFTTTAPSASIAVGVAINPPQTNLAISSTAPTISRSDTVTDDFNRANGGLGSNWLSDLTISTNTLQITGNEVQGSTTSHAYSIWVANSFGADQFCEITVGSNTGHFIALVLRHNGLTSGSSFYVAFVSTSTSNGFYLQRVDAGSFSAVLAQAAAAYTPTPGDVIRFEVSGTTLTGKINGVTQWSTTDATYASGSVAVGARDTGKYFDNFFAGPITGANALLNPARVDLVISPTAPSVVVSSQVNLSPARVDLTFSTTAPGVAVPVSINPPQGNLALSPTAPSALLSGTISPARVDLVITSIAPTLAKDFLKSPARVDLVITSVAPAVGLSKDLNSADLFITTTAPTVVTTRNLSPASVDLVLSRVAPLASPGFNRNPATHDLILSGTAPSSIVAVAVNPARVDLALSPTAPSVTKQVGISPARVDLAISATAPSVVESVTVSPAHLDLTVSTTVPTLTFAVAANPPRRDLVLSSVAPTVSALSSGVLSPPHVPLALSTSAPSVVEDVIITPAVASLVLSRVAPSAVPGFNRNPIAVDLAISATVPTVFVFQANNLIPASSNLTISLTAPTVVQQIVRNPARVDLTFSTFVPSVNFGIVTSPATHDLILSKVAPSVLVLEAGEIAPPTATLVLSTFAPGVSVVATGSQFSFPARVNLVLTTSSPLVFNGGLLPSSRRIVSASRKSRTVTVGRSGRSNTVAA